MTNVLPRSSPLQPTQLAVANIMRHDRTSMSQAADVTEDQDGTGTEQAKLLPPSAEPMPPPGMKDGDDVWYEPPAMPKPEESGYWIMKDILGSPDTRVKWVNEDVTGTPNPWLGRFEELPESPKWYSERSVPKGMSDYYLGLTHTVSQRILDVFREFDADHVKSIPVDYRFKDGATPKYPYHWMHVTRVIKAIDYANSEVRYEKGAGYPPYASQWGPTRLLPGTDRYPFFCAERPGYRAIFVSDAMKRRLEQIRPKLSRVWFRDLSDGPIVF